MEKLSNSQLNKMTKLQLKEVVRDYEGIILSFEEKNNDLTAERNKLVQKLNDVTDSHMTTNHEDAQEIQRLRGEVSKANNLIASYKSSWESEKKVNRELTDSNEALIKDYASLTNKTSYLTNQVSKYKLATIVAVIAFVIALCFACM